MSIQLRDRYIPEIITPSNIIIFDGDGWDTVLNKCQDIINLNVPGTYNINRPRRSGKTTLCACLMNNFDNCVMICNNSIEEIRVRRDYGIKSPNRYNIYSDIKALVGMSYDWLLIDDLSDQKWNELVYYKGFSLIRYIRIGTPNG